VNINRGDDMANQDHVKVLKQGVDAWNQWRKEQRKQLQGDEEPHVVHPDLSNENLSGIKMQGADLSEVNLENVWLKQKPLSGTKLRGANLKGAYLRLAKLQEADLQGADLSGANFAQANLQKANLARAHLEGASFSQASLAGTDLSGAFFDSTTELGASLLGDKNTGFVHLADIHWNDANIALIDWSLLKKLGEEQVAQQKKTADGRKKSEGQRLKEYQRAVRAYRQLAVNLRNQGMNENADYFAYRAQVLQRTVFRLRTVFGFHIGRKKRFVIIEDLYQPRITFGRRVSALFSWIFSWLLYLLAGYGYRPKRSLLWYLIIISCFTFAYSRLGGLPLPPDSLVFSLMSFHGRGFFPSLSSETNLHNPIVGLAAIEAVVGLFIEISFIATFTQRFFGK
jgi:Pentapeptide repeats (8 copies)